MKENYRYFKAENLMYTPEELGILFDTLWNTKTPGGHFSIQWRITSDFKRFVSIRHGGESTWLDASTTLLQSDNKFQEQFGINLDGTKATMDQLIDAIAIHDVHRQIRWILTSHYQRKIVELSRF